MFIDGFSSFSHHFLIIFSALNLRLEKNGSRRGDVPALQLPRLDLSISAAQLGRNDLWSWMVLVFEKIPWCPWWTPGFWMCFFVGNVNDNVNGYVWMILDVFGCCYEHILSNVWRFSFFCMVCLCLLELYFRPIGWAQKMEVSKVMGIPQSSSKSLDHDLE